MASSSSETEAGAEMTPVSGIGTGDFVDLPTDGGGIVHGEVLSCERIDGKFHRITYIESATEAGWGMLGAADTFLCDSRSEFPVWG